MGPSRSDDSVRPDAARQRFYTKDAKGAKDRRGPKFESLCPLRSWCEEFLAIEYHVRFIAVVFGTDGLPLAGDSDFNAKLAEDAEGLPRSEKDLSQLGLCSLGDLGVKIPISRMAIGFHHRMHFLRVLRELRV